MAVAVVLGSGMVGSVIAADLVAQGFHTIAIDSSDSALARARERTPLVETTLADLSDPGVIRDAVAGADIVVGALPSRLGFSAMKAVIEAGRNFVDISFMSEDFTVLNSLARARGVTVVADMGIAPGMSHILAVHSARLLDICERIDICVGGLPRERRLPFQYKAAFAPADVIEEYVRPARLVEHGQIITRPALSELEFIDFPGIGTLEAFNTDGLRSLCSTLRVPFMREKTLRYPGHADLMRAMREMGLFSEDPIDVHGQKIRPRDLTSAFLFPLWTYAPGEEDLTVMRVVAEGTKGARFTRYQWDLLDFYDKTTRATSMSRTTGFPCAIVASLVHAGLFNRPGVHPPERLADEPDLVETLLSELSRRGVRFRTA
jgi:lysine 6-dehydrogenase